MRDFPVKNSDGVHPIAGFPAVVLPISGLLAALLWTVVVWAQPHTLNLKDADMGVLISTVADITGKTFIVDPRVTGEVTVISSAPMTETEVYDIFLSILRVHALAAVETGDAVKIVPDSNAIRDASLSAGSALNPDDLVTRILEVDNLDAGEVVPIVRPLVAQQAHLAAHGASNLIVITDRAANVDRITRIIQRMDRSSGQDVDVIRLEHAAASEVIRLINSLSGEGAPTNAIADERTNTILLTGPENQRLRMRALVSHLDTPLEEGGSTQVVYLRYADAQSLVPILESVSQNLAGTEIGENTPPTIQAHPETNALIVTAPPAVFRSLSQVVRQLDIRRAQVLVEAVIAEVSIDTARELGVQWQLTSDLDGGEGVIGGTNFNSGGSNILNLSTNPLAADPGLNIGYLAGTVDILGTTIFEIGALVRALEADGDSNVLSTPSALTLDNTEANIKVGQEVPFVTGQFTNTGTDSNSVNPFTTIQREDVGLSLTVTPHINEGDSIILDIALEVSSLAPSSQGAVDLITNNRELTTKVLVGDGSLLVLGGLIDETVTETVQKVPALGDIPLLGNLFRYRSTNRLKRNLMIFLRPTILRDPNLADSVTGSKYQYMRDRQLEMRQEGTGLIDPESAPLLPELDEFLRADRTAPEQLYQGEELDQSAGS